MSKYNLTELAEGMGYKEYEDAKEADRLEAHPESAKIKAIQAMMAKEKSEKNEVMGVDRKGNEKEDTDGSDATKYKKAARDMNEDEMSHKDEMKMHLKQYRDGNIDGDDLANAFEEMIMGKVSPPGERGFNTKYGMEESYGVTDQDPEDDVVNVDKVSSPSAKGTNYGGETSSNDNEDNQEDKEIANPKPMYTEMDLSYTELTDDEKDGVGDMMNNIYSKINPEGDMKKNTGLFKYIDAWFESKGDSLSENKLLKEELTWYIEDENEDIRFQNDEYLREVGKKIKEIHPDISDEDLNKIIIMTGEQYSREEDFHGDSITSGNFVNAAVEIYQTDVLDSGGDKDFDRSAPENLDGDFPKDSMFAGWTRAQYDAYVEDPYTYLKDKTNPRLK